MTDRSTAGTDLTEDSKSGNDFAFRYRTRREILPDKHTYTTASRPAIYVSGLLEYTRIWSEPMSDIDKLSALMHLLEAWRVVCVCDITTTYKNDNILTRQVFPK
ncbi:hypothetical protein J6590_072192 [Homalodisca vitripennis]|nr:hypothetical protein J6590_072192 [Homalodisca vitripennis]